MTGEVSARWGFLGAGKMATALALGLIRSGLVAASDIQASDPFPQAAEAFSAATGASITHLNAEVARNSDVLVLAVKPQVMEAVLVELKPHVSPAHLVVSVAAGVSLASLELGLGAGCRLVRVMPNTPALVSAGASAFCLGSNATAADEQLVQACLGAVGTAVKVPESLLDAVTGLSGSGPAYVYQVIEALSDGGVRVGLPRETATALAAQTVLGAARMVLETGLHPAVLKDQVASPGGTTMAGLHALEKAGLRCALMNAVEAATQRSTELGVAAAARPANRGGSSSSG